MPRPVIGFSWPFTHDNVACVIVDGRLVYAVEEERFTRHKHAPREVPLKSVSSSLKYLKQIDIDPTDVVFAIQADPKYHAKSYERFYFPGGRYLGLAEFWLSQIAAMKNQARPHYDRSQYYFILLDHLVTLARMNFVNLAKVFLRHCYAKAELDSPKKYTIVPVPHHLAHAASAYYFSGHNHSSVITVDGMGEREATVVWKVKDGEFEPQVVIGAEESLGHLYEAVSSRFGFRTLEGPGKVMGLAPYGSHRQDYSERFNDFLKTDEPGKPPYSFPKKIWSYGEYGDAAKWLTYGTDFSAWDHKGPLMPEAADLAFALQEATERVMLALAKWTKDSTGDSYLAMAGGVALNAKSNMTIHYAQIFDDLFVFPIANDAGAPIGAAAWVYEHVLGEKMRSERLQTVFLGPEYTDDHVKRVIDKTKWSVEYVGNDVGGIADLVVKGNVVAWYRGRSELGPRALGNRSIIADPRRQEMWKIANQIKGREWWRPLAPSVLLEDATRYFVNPVHHPFMIHMFLFKDDVGMRVPAVCHVDKTSRPQTVRREDNKAWYDLIGAYRNLTGEGMILNTSFNLAGEPLVETPEDAFRSFALGGFDAMYMQGWLIRKR